MSPRLNDFSEDIVKKALSLSMLLLATLYSSGASALSTEQGSANSDGSAKYADPDEQRPGFIFAPENSSHVGASFTGGSTVTMPTVGESSPGAQAFDQAFAHQQK